MCDLEDIGVPSIVKLIRSSTDLARMFLTLDLSCEENFCLLLNDKSRRTSLLHLFVYYETIKRELNTRLIYECRRDEKLKAKAEGYRRLAYIHFESFLIFFLN